MLDQLLEQVIKHDASDLHLQTGCLPIIRLNSSLMPLKGQAVITAEQTKEIAFSLLNETQKQRLEHEGDIDFSYSYANKARFRANVYYQGSELSIALRLIPNKIRTVEELNLPVVVKEFAKPSQGFVLIVGPAGHGKSAVMAALIDIINHTRTDHVITIEDPIEYIFVQDKCIIDQREVHEDTRSFYRGLRSAFRQDADVIMIGEMRDPETIATAVTAAETGHLIFSTLHTNTASQTIDRIIDTFPGHQQNQIRAQLASTLLGIVSRRLLPRINGGLTSAAEVLFANPAVRNLIREGKTHQIDLVIETSAAEGMISLNKSLAELVRKKEISQQTAETYSSDPSELRTLLQKT